MDDDSNATTGAPGILDAMLSPLRLPGRVASDIDTLTRAVSGLRDDARKHLSSIDQRAGALVDGLGKLGGAVGRIERKVNTIERERMETLLGAISGLQPSIDRIERRVAELASLEATITERLDGVRADLNQRMLAVEGEVRTMHQPMTQMARDVAKIDELLPDPKDGPMARLKETLSSS